MNNSLFPAGRGARPSASSGRNLPGRWFFFLLLRSLAVILMVMAAVFFLMRLVPGDPAVMVLGEHASPDAVQALREKMGLDLPVSIQFFRFLRNMVFHLDTGTSLKFGVSCRQLVYEYAPVTLLLTFFAMAVTAVISILLAFLAATHQNGFLDHLVRIFPAFTQGMPVFWTGLLLILLFAVHWKIFPVGGLDTGSAAAAFRGMVLPAVTIAFGQIPPLVRSLRESILEVLHADFVTTLRAARLPRRRILYGHVLRNAFVPALMLFSVNFSYLIGGTLIVEQVFAIRGVGTLLFQAISSRDFPLVQAIAFYCALLVVLISALADLTAHLADPRIGRRQR
jgi:peptide/nickel transport system permease protein